MLKRNYVLTLLGVAALLAGCVVMSVYPYYTEKDLVYDSALEGTWVGVPSTNTANSAEDIWIFKKAGEQEYAFTLISEGQTNEFSAHLFKLENRLFFDFLSLKEETSFGLMHAHILLEVTQTQPTLKTSHMNHEWLKKLLEQDPKAIRHTVDSPDGKGGKNNEWIVLTAETPELQKFILKHLATEGAWMPYGEMKRR